MFIGRYLGGVVKHCKDIDGPKNITKIMESATLFFNSGSSLAAELVCDVKILKSIGLRIQEIYGRSSRDRALGTK